MTQWVVLCVGVLATVYLVMRGRMKGGKKADPMARAASVGMGLSQQRQVERDISNLMVEMLETARQMTAQLDTRAARLEVLIADADELLAEMRRAVAKQPVEAAVAQQVVDTPAVREEVRAAPLQVEVESAPVAELVEMPVPAPELTFEAPPDPRHAEIYTLADQGRTSGEIARSLNRPNGEVELILALRRG